MRGRSSRRKRHRCNRSNDCRSTDQVCASSPHSGTILCSDGTCRTLPFLRTHTAGHMARYGRLVVSSDASFSLEVEDDLVRLMMRAPGGERRPLDWKEQSLLTTFVQPTAPVAAVERTGVHEASVSKFCAEMLDAGVLVPPPSEASPPLGRVPGTRDASRIFRRECLVCVARISLASEAACFCLHSRACLPDGPAPARHV